MEVAALVALRIPRDRVDDLSSPYAGEGLFGAGVGRADLGGIIEALFGPRPRLAESVISRGGGA